MTLHVGVSMFMRWPDSLLTSVNHRGAYYCYNLWLIASVCFNSDLFGRLKVCR